jgi:hypothetical protein
MRLAINSYCNKYGFSIHVSTEIIRRNKELERLWRNSNTKNSIGKSVLLLQLGVNHKKQCSTQHTGEVIGEYFGTDFRC